MTTAWCMSAGGTGDDGVFTVGGEAFPVHLRNLPTIVESYKTYDDIHLVKSNDIGQVGGLFEAAALTRLQAKLSVQCHADSCCTHVAAHIRTELLRSNTYGDSTCEQCLNKAAAQQWSGNIGNSGLYISTAVYMHRCCWCRRRVRRWQRGRSGGTV